MRIPDWNSLMTCLKGRVEVGVKGNVLVPHQMLSRLLYSYLLRLDSSPVAQEVWEACHLKGPKSLSSNTLSCSKTLKLE